jgi:hypothetical protein
MHSFNVDSHYSTIIEQMAMDDIGRKLDEMGLLWTKQESLCYSCSNDCKVREGGREGGGGGGKGSEEGGAKM